MPLPTSIHYHFHKLAPDAEVLYVWIDSNRANTSDQGTLVETITSHDATLAFRHYAVKARSGKKRGNYAGGGLGVRNIARETVLRT
jgi:hypothetical protein